MMKTLLLILVSVVCVFWLVKKFLLSKSDSNPNYLKQGDVTAQENYIKSKHPEDNKMTLDEIIELSWKFLYDLTDIIMNKFSSQDQQKLLEQGRIMVQYGMKYQHVVDINPKVVASYTKKYETEKVAGVELQQIKR